MSADRPRPLVAGNWKMHGLKSSGVVLHELAQGYAPDLKTRVDLIVCPPATLIHAFVLQAEGSGIAIGAQDVHAQASGAYTGDISAEMLADLGASAVIVGHWERRALHGEPDAGVRARAAAARRAGLTAIVCVGETREEREGGRTLEVVRGQLNGSVPDGLDAA